LLQNINSVKLIKNNNLSRNYFLFRGCLFSDIVYRLIIIKFMQKIILTFSILFFSVLNLRAQDPLKPILSPNSANLLNLNAHEINLFTGTPNITLPLYSHTVDNYTMDIGLRYSSSGGVRVSDRSGDTGLGWHLTGGGSIVRTVRGFPDEMRISNVTYGNPYSESPFRYGYFHNTSYGSINWSPTDWQNIANSNAGNISIYNSVLRSIYGSNIQGPGEENFFYQLKYGQISDTEPDIFEFNFNGKSGKFMFNNQNGNITVHQVPWQGLKIEYTLAYSHPCCNVNIDKNHNSLPEYQKHQNSPVIVSFIVTDTDNTKYYFDTYDHVSHNYQMNSVTYRTESGFPSNSQDPMIYFDRNTYTWKQYAGSDQELVDMNNGNYYDDTPYSPAGNYNNTSEVYKYHTSSWQLTKVITSNGREIKYNYAARIVKQKVVNLQEKNKFLTYRNRHTTGLTLLDVIENKSFNIYENYLTDITSEDFKMVLYGDSINKRPTVDKIQIFYGKNVVKRFDLKYINSTSENVHLISGDDKKEYYRTILTELREYEPLGGGFKAHKFSYNLATIGGLPDQKLPHTYSFSIDQWGYYNGVDNKSYIPRLYIYPDLSSDNRRFRVDSIRNYSGRVFMMDGADRSSDSKYMTVGLLNKISYPTGGFVEYEFEANTYLDEGQSSIGPGVRIKKISSNFGTQKEEISYGYTDDFGNTSGRIVAKPVLARILSHTRSNPVNDLAYYDRNLSRYGDSQAELSTVDSRLLGYGQVTEFRSGLGKIVYTFSNQGILGQNDDYREEEEDGDGNLVIYGGCIGANCDGLFWRPKVDHVTFYMHNQYRPMFTLNPASYDTFPFAPASNYDWNRGHMLSKVIYDNNGKKLVEVQNIYKNVTPSDRNLYNQIPTKIKGLKIGSMIIGRPNDNPMLHGSSQSKGLSLRVASYVLLTDIVKVLSSTSTTTYHSGSSITTRESTSYEYKNKDTALPTRVQKINSKGHDEEILYYYPSDLLDSGRYNNESILNMMVNKRIFDKPILIRKKTGNRYLSEIFNNYRVENWSGHLSYRITEIFEKTDGILINPASHSHRNVTYDYYNWKGNILQYTIRKSGAITIIWGYGGQYPIAEIKNATYPEVLDVLTQSIINNLNSPLVSDDVINAAMIKLRTDPRLAKAMITSYTYQPLVGMKSKTDPRGVTEHYEYDGFQRLKAVLDQLKNVTSSMDYHYRSN